MNENAGGATVREQTTELPAVDVVVATTGSRAALLRAALEAIWHQTYAGRIDCVVAFDRTEPDTSLERESPTRSIRVVANVRTPGLAGGRNSGVAVGQGRYIAFCDDDDEWMPRKVERQVAVLQGSDALCSVSGITIAYEDHEVTRIPEQSDMTVQTLVRRRVMPAHPSSVLVRREAMLGAIGPVDEEIPGSFGEDYDWIIRAAKAGPVAVVPESLVKVQWGGSMFSHKWPVILEALDYLVAKHPEFARDRRAIARIRGQRAFALAALGRRGEALREVARTVAAYPAERRALAAGLVAVHAVSAERLMAMANRRGRGI